MQHVCHALRRVSSAIKFNGVEIAFILASSYWLITFKQRRKPEYPEKTPYDELHSKAQKF